MGILIGGVAAILLFLIVGTIAIYTLREPGRRVRRKELAAANDTVNSIDDVVDRYHPQLDIVGQAMAADIRHLISEHRKGTR